MLTMHVPGDVLIKVDRVYHVFPCLLVAVFIRYVLLMYFSIRHLYYILTLTYND